MKTAKLPCPECEGFVFEHTDCIYCGGTAEITVILRKPTPIKKEK